MHVFLQHQERSFQKAVNPRSSSGHLRIIMLDRYRQLFSLHFKTKAQDFLRVVCAKKELKSGIPLTIGIRNPSSSDVDVRVKLSNLSLLI